MRITSNNLTLNVDNCETLVFGSGKLYNVSIPGEELPDTIPVNTFELHPDCYLKFREHIEHVAKKLNTF